MRRRFLLVHNPQAGVRGSTVCAETVATLRAAGAAVEELRDDGDMYANIPSSAGQDFDAVVAAGGDGTFRAVAERCAAIGVAAGLIPCGTGNVLARELGLKRSAPEIARTLLLGPEFRLVGAIASGAAFFLMAGAGFDAEIVRRLSRRVKRGVGRAAYLLPGVGVLARPLVELNCSIDGVGHKAFWVVAANAQRYGGAFRLSSAAGLHVAGLSIALFKSPSKAAFMRQLMTLAQGKLDCSEGVEIIQGHSLSVTSERPVSVQIDGDSFGVTPVDIEWGQPTVTLIVPDCYLAGAG